MEFISLCKGWFYESVYFDLGMLVYSSFFGRLYCSLYPVDKRAQDVREFPFLAGMDWGCHHQYVYDVSPLAG